MTQRSGLTTRTCPPILRLVKPAEALALVRAWQRGTSRRWLAGHYGLSLLGVEALIRRYGGRR